VDISKWTPDEILALPDFCLGRRFPIFVALNSSASAWIADISEANFPDPAILWSVGVWFSSWGAATLAFRLGLGNRLPVSDAEFDTLEAVLHGFGTTGPEPRAIRIEGGAYSYLINCKTMIRTAGRRLCICAVTGVVRTYTLHVTLVVSAVPKEVPDWVFSGQVKSQ